MYPMRSGKCSVQRFPVRSNELEVQVGDETVNLELNDRNIKSDTIPGKNILRKRTNITLLSSRLRQTAIYCSRQRIFPTDYLKLGSHKRIKP